MRARLVRVLTWERSKLVTIGIWGGGEIVVVCFYEL